MVKSITKYNLPQNYKDRTDLINQVINYINIDRTWKTIHNKPSTQKEWDTFLFQKNGWQLSFYGNIIFRATFTSYKVDNVTADHLTGKIIINLSKLVNGPWCHRGSSLYIWNQPCWFEMQMFEGDLKRYIDFYMPN